MQRSLILSLLLFTLLLVSAPAANAQTAYKHGLGLRLGPSYGLTYKTFLGSKVAFEGIFSSRYYGNKHYYYTGNGKKKWYGYNSGSGFNLTGLVEYHLPFSDVKGLMWYFGGGLHIGSWRGYYDHPYYPDDRYFFTMGIDLMLGLEYVFDQAPISLALDFKPAFDFVGAYRPWPDEIAFSIRVLLDRL